MRIWHIFVVILVGVLSYLLTPPRPFPDRLAPIPEARTTIDNSFYNLPEFANSWWDPSMNGLAALQVLNPGRTGYFRKIWLRELGANITEYGKFLDVGCGGGIATEQLAKFGFDITGIDLSPRSLETARKHAAAAGVKNVRYLEGSAYSLPFPDASFDGVIISDVLEHLLDLPRAVSEIARVLKPGGVVVYDTVTRTFLSSVIHTLMQDVLRAIPGHAHDWRLFVTPEEMVTVFARHGLEADIKETRALGPVLHFSLDGVKRAFRSGIWGFVVTFEEKPRDAIVFSYMGWARKPSSV